MESKRVAGIKKKVEQDKRYSLSDAVAGMKECATAKFDETVELAFYLGVDPRQYCLVVFAHFAPGAASIYLNRLHCFGSFAPGACTLMQRVPSHSAIRSVICFPTQPSLSGP